MLADKESYVCREQFWCEDFLNQVVTIFHLQMLPGVVTVKLLHPSMPKLHSS